MPTVGKVHTQEGVSRFQDTQVNGHICLRPRVGLHVDVVSAENLLRPANGQRLSDINELASTVVASAGVPFRVFVRHDRSAGLKDRLTHKILGSDEFELESFPLGLPPYLLPKSRGRLF